MSLKELIACSIHEDDRKPLPKRETPLDGEGVQVPDVSKTRDGKLRREVWNVLPRQGPGLTVDAVAARLGRHPSSVCRALCDLRDDYMAASSEGYRPTWWKL